MWVALALLSGGMLLWPYVKRNMGGAGSLGTLQATIMINKQDAQVLDVRGQEEYDKGHIINARHIPLAQLETRIGELDKFKDKPVIVHCETGARAGGACAILRKHGFTSVFSLDGGIAAWRQAGLPLEK
jgi:rhodanese-related sulfurtransferase